ncbi:MAG: TerC family protein [Alphaproteobacteria bacterium]|nr:TerC family protein [Alphaproteobacteria bacterium]MCL2504728.1 TerC family protein [Alphaproteobacteria bacterium]
MFDVSFVFADFMGQPLWMWLSFAAIIFSLLALDLGVINKNDHEIGMKESLIFSSIYIAIGLLFGGWIWLELGRSGAMEYWTGFIVEKTLSIDNIFVIAMLFSFFSIPRLYQHRVLFWGILGAIVLRGLMIAAGIELVTRFEWVLHLFALFLIFTGIKMLVAKDKPVDIKNNPVFKCMQKHLRISHEIHGNKFFIKQPSEKTGKNVLYATPLFLCLVMVEFADVLFAIDSIPAILMITTEPIIVFTSNIFAILGLRSLYFVLAAFIQKFHYLKYALSLLLIFIGSKTFIAYLLDWEKFPISLSLGITFLILSSGIAFSLLKTRTYSPSANS